MRRRNDLSLPLCNVDSSIDVAAGAAAAVETKLLSSDKGIS